MPKDPRDICGYSLKAEFVEEHFDGCSFIRNIGDIAKFDIYDEDAFRNSLSDFGIKTYNEIQKVYCQICGEINLASPKHCDPDKHDNHYDQFPPGPE